MHSDDIFWQEDDWNELTEDRLRTGGVSIAILDLLESLLLSAEAIRSASLRHVSGASPLVWNQK